MITDFPQPPASNLGGLSGFRYIPHTLVTGTPAVIRSIVAAAVPLQSGYRFLEGLSVTGQLQFTEEKTDSANGPAYNWTVAGFYPGDSDEAVELFCDLEQARHLEQVRDQSGRLRLVGLGAPLTFTAKYSSGAVPGEARGYSFTFSGAGRRRAPFYRLG